MSLRVRRFALVAGLLLPVLLPAAARKSAPIDFNRDIRPIFSENCYACHGPDKNKRKAGLRFDVKEEALKKLESGDYAIVPGKSGESKLVKLITTSDEDDRMPPTKVGKRLTKEQINLLKQWIQEGAQWKDHWSYIPPQRPELPVVKSKKWPRNEVDNFILARLEKEKLGPSPEADKTTLLRRVSFDLTGLPPTVSEVDAFLADSDANAYEKVVDRLLAAPQYGERMAQVWLDLARYADTSGYHFDSPRYMWLWREWVIKAFNENVPFDRFTVEQLAGDLLPKPTREQRIASGFHRNVMTNDEGGADPDEYLAKYIVDRISTTAVVWLGTTLGCAECHDHKYDRISQKEFYQFYAFFHNVSEKGLDGTRTENPLPRMQVPTTDQAGRMIAFTNSAIPGAEALVQQKEAELPKAQEQWEKEVASSTNHFHEPRGLLARFTFDDTLAFDDGVKTNVAVYSGTNSPPFGTGKVGRSLKFDGKGNFADAGQAGILQSTNAFSYGAWVKFDAKGGAILSKMEEGPGYRGYDLLVESGKITAHLIDTWPSNAIKITTKEAVSKDLWHQLMLTYDGSSKAAGLKIFVDGKSVALETPSDKLTGVITNSVPMHIGNRGKTLPYTGRIDDVRFYARALDLKEIAGLATEPDLAVARMPVEKRTEVQKADLKRFFRENHASELKKAEEVLASLKQKRDALNKEIPTTMVMDDLPKPRDTFILVRGNFQSKGEKVMANVPKFLPPLAEGLPTNRLGLAEWLVATNHPLTSRVTVNRFWQMLFGTGLVKTVNDFGSQGEWPSHPELLDWLATEFMARDWDMKAMLKLMVTSATYRQSGTVTPALLERDRYNRLLSRGPRLRLEAEFVRDNALSVSGLLNARIGGPSIKPYQPGGLWEMTDATYEPSKGEDLYRRGIYVYWKRSAHYPSFATFDAPNREICTAQRARTSTPLQSLVLMNDPVYVEAARAMAGRIIRERSLEKGTASGERLVEALIYAFRLAVARAPSAKELEILERTYREQLENFQSDKKSATELLAVGELRKAKDMDESVLAAWTGVANVLLNLNETITK